MLLSMKSGAMQLETDRHQLKFLTDKPFVYLGDQFGRRLAELFVLSSIHPMHTHDDTTQAGEWEVEEREDEVLFTTKASSSAWLSKTYRFRCQPSRLVYEVEVEGSGQLAEANYFGGFSSSGCIPAVRRANLPEWWREPIFCGWGEQCYQAENEKGKAPSYSRQDLYDSFLAALSGNDIEPGTVVLDDKWQATYGQNQVDVEKWPDLRGFIDRQHAEGKKVLLWLKAWDPEGVPLEECITNAAGLPLAVDPTNPAYQDRLRESIH
jgi:hypothetical protein